MDKPVEYQIDEAAALAARTFGIDESIIDNTVDECGHFQTCVRAHDEHFEQLF